MAYSYSALKEFKNCPRKYYEVRVLKRFVQGDTQATLYGKEVHKALEDYVGEGTPLGPHERFQPIADMLKNMKGEKLTEFEMGLDESLNPCGFLDKECFIRGIADLVIIDNETKTASIFDYKTGSAKYPDTEQLELMALMVFRHFPEIEHVRAALLFILYDKIITAEYHKKDAKTKWVNWASKIEQIEIAKESGVFNENPSGLCGWCVVTDCPHYRERK